MKNYASILFLTLVLFFSFPWTTSSSTIDTIKYVTSKNYYYEKNNMVLAGKYPVISNLDNEEFQKYVNDEITNIISDYISKKETTSKKIDLTYQTIIYNNYLSILVFFENSVTKEVTISSITIDTQNFTKILINDLIGSNGLAYANKVALSKADDLGIKSIEVTNSTPFYVEDGKIFLIYGAGELTFVQKGNITIEISPSNLKNYTLSKSAYYKKSNYNVKMIPLRQVLEALGYEVLWDQKTGNITINTSSGVLVSVISPNENKYSKGTFAPQALEFAPEIVNNTTYVPISFFSEIIGLLYSTDENENIVFSKYSI